MPNVDQHAPGSFCWFELGTTDQNAAKSFYQTLFGWTSEDYPMGENGTYTMFRLDGREVAAAYTLDPQRYQGVPPFWMLYVSTDNADAIAQRASQLGGNVHMPPFDVAQFGRMTVIGDPTGAVFSVWQPIQSPGVGLTGVDGTVCWADLSTPAPARAKDFYGQLFGWRITASENDPSGYLHIANGETYIGGIPPAEYRNPQAPPHWMLYFQVSDCAASTGKAKDLGASELMPPQQVQNVGTMSILKDPQGAVFALFRPR
jgi:predicted enzyme related to lactoylglutathione lyase